MTPVTLLADLAARLPASLKTRSAAVAVVAALQIGVLGFMIADRVRLLKTGREVMIPVVPVDPRDLFKGDYARLDYNITSVAAGIPGTTADTPRGQTAYVTIEQQADGSWTVVRSTAHYPADLAGNQIALLARCDRSDNCPRPPFRAHYGIERYYVPEGKGDALEKLAREKKLSVILAIDGRGSAAIKGLSANGQRVYDEPLF